MAKRTDIHRPGAIVPSEYEPVLYYSGATSDGGWPVPSDGINCELDRRHEIKGADGKTTVVNGKHDEDGLCCVIGLIHVAKVKFAATGGTQKCSVCGAWFVYGQVWKHVLTGEHIHLGHDCADKYELVSNDPEWTAQLAMLKQRRAAYIEHLMREKRLETAYVRTPGLEDALSLDHPITIDLKDKLRRFGELSASQIDLAFRLRADSYCPERPDEIHVPAPEGRMTVRGVLVSKKSYDSAYGTTIKGTIKVRTDDGVWLAWGTLPSKLLDARPEIGAIVEITATLKRGRDAHFAIYSRPTGGKVL